MIEKSCFAYTEEKCKALYEMVCKTRKCPFFKTEQQAERDYTLATERLKKIGRIVQEKRRD